MSQSIAPLTVVHGPFKSLGKINGQELMSISNETGLIDEAILEEGYVELIGHAPKVIGDGMVGPFDDMEQIQKFCFTLCQNLNNSGVSFVSLEKFNELLKGSFKVEDLRGRLEKDGNFLKNPDAQKSGLLNKFF